MLTIAERRRLVVAIALTVLVLPLALFGGGSDSDQTTPRPVASQDEPAAPAFLPVQGSSVVPDIITVNVPAPPEDVIAKGIASFIRWPQTFGLRPCATPLALIGAKIEVRNLNNGRTVKCENVSIQSLAAGISIVIHTDLFLEIADLVDAPLPVDIIF
jgi:hypothetical protein